ncbi:putative bifunctional diguanylate cyclase/phosphodiesterase [Microvirga zambiensis]|uniref:putative bifunctional diguanylate cyclase/phosphodiesterase n=1 Tax=Microvirga zambiensis TaxID=1402137 RepID=UPI00191F60D0|nr:bifunctional diguanylate cyclase/phosphodiesterase [Microvirga zambiensis]
MPAGATRFHLRKYIAAALLSTAILGGLVVFAVDLAIDRAVSADARARAEDWAKYFVATIPEFDELVSTGHLTDRQRAVVSTALVGNVFRFKLYDARGNAVLQSDLETFANQEQHDHIDDEAMEVIASKQPLVSLKAGARERNMPSLYAEAYVPVLDRAGNLRAVAETYVDETRTGAFYHQSLGALAVALGVGFAFSFGIPTVAFLIRTRQAREVRHQAEFLASHDPMTGLLNRTRFSEIVQARIANRVPGRQMALVILDIDNFKLINDDYGHAAGDEFLKHVARGIGRFRLDEDIVARAGGDEFVIALTRASVTEMISDVKAIMATISKPIRQKGDTMAAHVSAGIYVMTDEGATVEEALSRAEVALHESKIDGKNRVSLFSRELDERMRKRRELEDLVQHATANKGFELHYQPLFAIDHENCVGFEALLRLKDRQGAYVPPTTFVPIAESMGLIAAIGKWVIVEATRTAATWPSETFVSVNLSVCQFQDQTLVSTVEDALKESGLAPHRLELEVTESMLMEDNEGIAEQLRSLKALGVSVAMDDFGTGYSSLAYLWQFGFDKLKIDRSFVSALEKDEHRARQILNTIIMLAHQLGMKVTAEGIETARQAEILRGLACDQFQGYLFGRPAPASGVALVFTSSGISSVSPASVG